MVHDFNALDDADWDARRQKRWETIKTFASASSYTLTVGVSVPQNRKRAKGIILASV
jgi:hypothetical protein